MKSCLTFLIKIQTKPSTYLTGGKGREISLLEKHKCCQRSVVEKVTILETLRLGDRLMCVCVCVCVHGIVFVSMHVWVVVRVHAQMLRVSSLSVPGPYSAFLMSRHPASRYFKEKQERCNQSKQTLWLLLLLSVAVCLKHLIYSCGNLPAVISIKNTIKAVFSLLKSTSSFILQPCSRQGKRPRGLSATRE